MRFHAKVGLLFLLLFAAPTFADSSRESLEALFAATYDLNAEIDSGWVLSRERDLASWKRMKAVRQAIATGEDLSFLEKYGLEKRGPSSYEVNLREHPEWMTSINLLGHLSYSRLLEKNQTELYQLGVSVAEVQKLGRYVLAYGVAEMRIQAKLDFLQNEGNSYVSRFLQGGEDFTDIYIELTHEINLAKHIVETDWAIDLFNLFDKEGQEILLTYSLSRVSSGVGMGKGTYNQDQEVDAFVGYFLSGELSASVRESLLRRKERRKAENAKVNMEFKPPVDKAINECRCPPKQCSYKNS
ncbi:hypothetical protein [Microbulbifer epialgicus]|uniref:Curli production assembly/transport component CsgG n=1 Tax=Microbulbifer epialgicus TaxID=393907 RepID=A0ABV4P2Y8_9GAMM